MQTHEIAQIFSAEYNGQKNIMTPCVERYGKAGPFVYEISSGRGFHDETIYGFTVLEIMPDGSISRSDRSKCCHSRADVDSAIASLKVT